MFTSNNILDSKNVQIPTTRSILNENKPLVSQTHEDGTMQAILIPSFVSNPSTLTPTEVPLPQPSPDEYLVCITHCSPQHADILHAKGTHQNVNAKKGNVHPPFILGYDFAGIIEQAPQNSKLRKGDRVFGASIGAFAEYVAVQASRIRKIPDGVSSKVACAISGQAVSYAAVVHVARVKRDETVLVSGASGGLGSACCMVAKALGARVIARYHRRWLMDGRSPGVHGWQRRGCGS
jgi:NADPH2:quinone reductase